jgi:hypothetical protein
MRLPLAAVQRPVMIFDKMRGRIITAGADQCEVEVTHGPENLVGKRQIFITTDLKEEPMSDNSKDRYNALVEQAIAMGLSGYKPIATRFRDDATAAKRIDALAEAIEAHKAMPKVEAGPEAELPTQTEEPEMKKAKKTRAKKKEVAPPKTKKSVVARDKANGRTGVVAEFGTRAGGPREKLLLFLNTKKNKRVPLTEASKHVYGNKEKIVALKMLILGLDMAIKASRLPYRVEYEGKGEDTSIMLATK